MSVYVEEPNWLDHIGQGDSSAEPYASLVFDSEVICDPGEIVSIYETTDRPLQLRGLDAPEDVRKAFVVLRIRSQRWEMLNLEDTPSLDEACRRTGIFSRYREPGEETGGGEVLQANEPLVIELRCIAPEGATLRGIRAHATPLVVSPR